MGFNSYYYDGLQPKMRAGMIKLHECILTSTYPQYDKRLFIELQAQFMKIARSEHVLNSLPPLGHKEALAIQ